MKTRRLLRYLVFIVLVVLQSGGQNGVAGEIAATPIAGQAAHYLVFEKTERSLVPRWYRQVRVAAPLQSLSDTQMVEKLTQNSSGPEILAVVLQSGDGQTVYQNVVQAPRWLRGEFHGRLPGDVIDGHFFPLKSASFVVRMPAIEAKTLTLLDAQQTPLAQFDLNQLIASTPAIDLKTLSSQHTSVQPTGDPANRVDLLILGDGYTNAQASLFHANVTAYVNSFFNLTPYLEYRNYVNVASLFVPSDQSGADHPPFVPECAADDPTCCGDPTMQYDPLQGTFVNTAFNGRFCAANIHRLLIVDADRVLAAAAAAPDWDQITVIINDPTYGGSGGQIAVTSMHPQTVTIAQHE